MRAEKKQLIARNTSADVVVKTPNTLKMVASRLGYTVSRVQKGRYFPERIGEALAHCQGTCDVTHLVGEFPMIACRVHKVMKCNGGDEKAYRQANQDRPQKTTWQPA